MRSAFTMLELVFVIVIIAILGVLALPSFNKNDLELAAEQVASDIRYTQHLAMRDDKFNPDPNDSDWYKKMWQIRFQTKSGIYGYSVFADNNKGRNVDYNEREAALDPIVATPIQIFRGTVPLDGSPSNLTKKYKINNISIDCKTSDGSLATANLGVLAFDNMGRPYNGIAYSAGTKPLQYILEGNCDIALVNPNGDITLRVHPETGYVCTINPTTNDCVKTI